MKQDDFGDLKALLPPVYSWLGELVILPSQEDKFENPKSTGSGEIALDSVAHVLVVRSLAKQANSASNSSVSTPAHPLRTNPNETKKGADFLIDSPHLSETTRNEIFSQCQEQGWSPDSGSVHQAWLGKGLYILVPGSSIEASPSQKGRQAGLDLASYLRRRSLRRDLVLYAGQDLSSLDFFDGLASGLYELKSFKKDTKSNIVLPKTIYLCDNNSIAPHIERYRVSAQALALVRMLEDSPPNWLNSERFAEVAQWLAKELGIRCHIKGREEIEALGMGAFHSVAKGTFVDPKLIVLEIPGKDPNKTVALIGKGLTFDSGGISLKTAAGMSDMKYDMCGAGAVLGAAYILSKITPPTRVVCLIGAVENMPSNQATRPGDIVRTMSGKTVEILNTDAEGRLVLADLLHYAIVEYQPKLLIDIATLTGAVLIALGNQGAAILSNSQERVDAMLKLAREVGEPLWQLPLWPELAKEVKSEIADLKNIANSNIKAGCLIGGAFLREFVGSTDWIHLDIAGTGWDCKALGFPGSGASGFGVRLLAASCLKIDQERDPYR
ncbi:MAG: leucyl aminopeptidase family protein [Oligoflexales bacterium]|nr:leucyl aminopeptidase family protein [Oligoflexales bacterium]